tara:strand:- start:1252 stop:1662 length:411 start_codon:yes stop_codon:yes gene_type:complete
MKTKKLVIKYIFFSVVATAVNLLCQRLIINENLDINNYIIGVLIGTLAGLIIKYFLDKNFIFYENEKRIKQNIKKFSFYSLNGVLTTIVFWSIETIFYLVFKTTLMREVGAIIGLSLGYSIKYFLDKKYVFNNSEL